MQSEDTYIIRDLGEFGSVTEALKAKGLSFEYRILNKEIIESNRYISRMLKIPLASRVFYLRKLRVIEGIPKSIEKTYLLYDKIKGIEDADLAHHSFYGELKDRFGYVTQKSEEEVLIVTVSEEEQRLLENNEEEQLMIKGVTYVEPDVPFEYFEIVSVSDFYRFRSVTEE